MSCDNDSSMGAPKFGVPQCYKNEAEYKVTVVYTAVERDELRLCALCAQRVRDDAIRHGYIVKVTRL